MQCRYGCERCKREGGEGIDCQYVIYFWSCTKEGKDIPVFERFKFTLVYPSQTWISKRTHEHVPSLIGVGSKLLIQPLKRRGWPGRLERVFQVTNSALVAHRSIDEDVEQHIMGMECTVSHQETWVGIKSTLTTMGLDRVHLTHRPHQLSLRK